MKNIHVLPTDKPSRLFKFANQLHLDTIPKEYYKKYNIYITSDEEIKEGDWYLNLKLQICQKSTDKNYLKGTFDSCKKIILTTDPDLIADGVQAIDNEFLEWFVKNPSFEGVEIEDFPTIEKYNSKGEYIHNSNWIYKIIIPQEEPKQETLTYTEAAKKEERIFNSTMMSKQETLEEAAANLADPNLCKTDNWIAGAKWQAERSQMIVPPDATNIEVFAIKPDKNGKLFAYIGYKISNGNFEFSVVPFTEPKPERMYSEEDLRKAFKHGILFKEQSVSTCNEAIETEFSMLVEQFKKK